METKSYNKINDKRKIFHNYFSNNRQKEDRGFGLRLDLLEEKESDCSFNTITRNRNHRKNLSVDKHMRNKSFTKGVNRNTSTDITNKSALITNLNTTENKGKSVGTYANNISSIGPNFTKKRIEDFLNVNFCKLNDSKISKILSKSPINNNNNSNINISHNNILSKLKNSKNFKNNIRNFENF